MLSRILEKLRLVLVKIAGLIDEVALSGYVVLGGGQCKLWHLQHSAVLIYGDNAATALLHLEETSASRSSTGLSLYFLPFKRGSELIIF